MLFTLPHETHLLPIASNTLKTALVVPDFDLIPVPGDLSSLAVATVFHPSNPVVAFIDIISHPDNFLDLDFSSPGKNFLLIYTVFSLLAGVRAIQLKLNSEEESEDDG